MAFRAQSLVLNASIVDLQVGATTSWFVATGRQPAELYVVITENVQKVPYLLEFDLVFLVMILLCKGSEFLICSLGFSVRIFNTVAILIPDYAPNSYRHVYRWYSVILRPVSGNNLSVALSWNHVSIWYV